MHFLSSFQSKKYRVLSCATEVNMLSKATQQMLILANPFNPTILRPILRIIIITLIEQNICQDCIKKRHELSTNKC
jgi:type IV secretory pathway TraG/TraD family ATPase VirD4